MDHSRINEKGYFASHWQTPIGWLRGLRSEHGWVELSLMDSSESRRGRPKLISPAPGELSDRGADTELGQFLSEYFDAHTWKSHLPLDLKKATPFQARVWQSLRDVPFGRIVSYRELAGRVNCPKGARAIGQCMARNPLLLIIPCHRVLAGGPTHWRPGGFTGGLGIKHLLLTHEGNEAYWRNEAISDD